MLVLSRKCQEVVVVTKSDGFEALLKVTVLAIENGKVRLGFEAAEDVPVHRHEVWQRIRDNAQIAPIAKTEPSPDLTAVKKLSTGKPPSLAATPILRARLFR